MPTSVVYGPFLKQKSAGNSAPTDSNVRSYTRTRANNRVFRKKPTPLLTSPTNYFIEDETRTVGTQYFRDPVTFGVSYAPSLTASSFTGHSQFVTRSREIAVSRLLEKVKGEVWNLSTFMGELPETLGWFKQTAKALVDSYIAVRRGRIKDVARIVKRARRRLNRVPVQEQHRVTGSLSKRWLEWRYAVSPLMYDMEDMLAYLYQARVKTYIRREAGGDQGTWSNVVRGSSSRDSLTQVAEWHVRALLYYSVNPNIEAFKKLGLLNPLATLWELTPLSFVVDWFLPIGTYIAHLDAMAGVSVISRTLSTRETLAEDRRPPYYVNSWVSAASEYRAEKYSRQNSYSLFPPLPRFGLSLSGRQVLDSLALVRSIALRG